MAVDLRPEILLIKQNKTVPTPDPISKTFSIKISEIVSKREGN